MCCTRKNTSLILMKQRLPYLDAVGGLMIVHMIAFHIFQAGKPGFVADFMNPLSFFMFWFFYKSGMMSEKRDWRTIIHHGLKKMLVPYFIFNIVGYAVWTIKQEQIGCCLNEIADETFHTFLYSATLPGNIALWFLPSLLVVQVLFSCSNLTPPENKKRRYAIIVLALVFCFYLSEEYISCPCYIKNIPLGLAVYIFGYIMKNKQGTSLFFFLSAIIYIIILLLKPSSINFMENKVINGNYILAIIYSFAGCILINNLMMRLLPNGISLLNCVGKKSMDYYAPHMIVLTLCLFTPLCLVPYIKYLQCCACVVILPLFSVAVERLGCEWIFGKSK